MPFLPYRDAVARARGLFARLGWPGRTSPHSQAGIAADRERYRAAVAALPAETRRVYLLHRVEALDIATIAARTGRSTHCVELHLADAILAIWRALDDAPD